MINDNWRSLNHSWTIKELIIANIIPFNTPILNSFNMFWLKLFFVKSLVASVLTVTANVCMPALPPIEATIGIKNASTTICSIVAPNKLMHHVAKNAVNKFNSSQLNLLYVFLKTPSVITSSPTPANLKASSSASSFNTVKTSSLVIIPTSLFDLSTTQAEFKL